MKSSKAIKVGGKQKPYKMWQAGISLAASPLAKSLAGFMAALPPRARPLTNPASYAGYEAKALVHHEEQKVTRLRSWYKKKINLALILVLDEFGFCYPT